MPASIPPEPIVSKRLESDLAVEYAEMNIIKACLTEGERAIALYFYRMRHGLSEGDNETAISQSLFRDGVVQVMACFTTNLDKRNKFLIPAEAFDGVEGWPEFYEWLHGYRDAYAAHNFGTHRMCEAIATKNAATGNLIRIAHLASMHIGPMDDVKDSMHTFITRAQMHVDARIDKLHANLVEEVSQMSPEAFAQLSPPRLVIGGYGNQRMSRHEYRKRLKGSQPPSGD